MVCTKINPLTVPAIPNSPSSLAIGINTIWKGMNTENKTKPKINVPPFILNCVST